MWRTRRQRLAFSFALLSIALLCAREAPAETVARLDYSRGAGAGHCADAAELERAVSERLGESPFDAGAARAYQVRILEQDGRLVGLVTLLDAHGTPEGLRRFEGTRERCDELVSALALAISITINPDLDVGPGGEPGTTPSAESTLALSAAGASAGVARGVPPPPGVIPARVDSAGSPLASAGPGLGFGFGFETHAAVGSGPAPTAGVGLFGRVHAGRFSGAVEWRYDAPVNRAIGDAFVSSRLAGVSAVPCLHFGPAFGCGVLLVANVSAAAEGVSDGQSASGWFVASGPRLGVGVMFGDDQHFGLEGRLDALLALKTMHFVLNGESVWQAPPVSGTLAAAAVWRIP